MVVRHIENFHAGFRDILAPSSSHTSLVQATNYRIYLRRGQEETIYIYDFTGYPQPCGSIVRRFHAAEHLCGDIWPVDLWITPSCHFLLRVLSLPLPRSITPFART